MEPIKNTIENIMQTLKTRKQRLPKDNPENLLKKVLTKRQLSHIKFNYFRNGVLGLAVDSSSRLYQLSLQKESLLAKLSKRSAAVKDIRFRLGEIK